MRLDNSVTYILPATPAVDRLPLTQMHRALGYEKKMEGGNVTGYVFPPSIHWQLERTGIEVLSSVPTADPKVQLIQSFRLPGGADVTSEDASLVVTKVAERGNKFEGSRQCIASHNSSIVFLPKDVSPGDLVRVRLIPIRDTEGNERRDSRGSVMYRAEWSPPKVPRRFKKELAEEARMLRSLRVLPQKEGEAVLRTWFGDLPVEVTGFDWYYFAEEHVCYGSRFAPAALLLFENLLNCEGSGVLELIAWLVEEGYYKKRQQGREVEWNEIPDLSEKKIAALLYDSKALGLLAKQLA